MNDELKTRAPHRWQAVSARDSTGIHPPACSLPTVGGSLFALEAVMAPKFRKIDPRIWTDEKFRKLPLEGQHLALWLLTTSRLNRCGIVLWSPGLASEETKIDRHSVETVLDTVCHTLFWVFDRAAQVVFSPHWWRYNKPDNESAMKGAMSDLRDVPTGTLKPYLEMACEDLPEDLHTVYHTLLDTVSYTVSPQEKEKEKEKEKEQIHGVPPHEPPVGVKEENGQGKPRSKKVFKPPTVDDVIAYCLATQSKVDPMAFVDYYTSNGWKVGGKSAMKDWRAAVRNWERRNKVETKIGTDEEDPQPNFLNKKA
jgi:hypothetical protein